MSSAARPTACTDTVAATRMKAMRISESTIRVWLVKLSPTKI